MTPNDLKTLNSKIPELIDLWKAAAELNPLCLTPVKLEDGNVMCSECAACRIQRALAYLEMED